MAHIMNENLQISLIWDCWKTKFTKQVFLKCVKKYSHNKS